MSAHYLPRRLPESLHRDIRGLQHHFTRWAGSRADAPPVVLLHGFMDCGATFQFVADAIAPTRSLVAPDWRGFGRSGWNPHGYCFPDYFADLDAMLDWLQAGLWECRAQHLEAQREGADDCASQRPRPWGAALLDGNYESVLGWAQENMRTARKELREGKPPDRMTYVGSIQDALFSKREDLAVRWLDEGLRAIGSNDPADLISRDMSPRRTFIGKWWALTLARACQAAGRDEDARRLTEMGRVSSGAWDPGLAFARGSEGAFLGVMAAMLDNDNAEGDPVARRHSPGP